MNKIIRHILIIMVIVFIGVFLFWQGRKLLPANLLTPTPVLFETVNWVNYTNKILGFSISIPEKVQGINRCEPDKTFSVSLKTFEDDPNNVVYFVPEYYYDNLKPEDTDCIKKNIFIAIY